MLSESTKTRNYTQRICGCCHKPLYFPVAAAKIKYGNLHIEQGYCRNAKCMVYNRMQRIEFVDHECGLNLGHRYFDNNEIEVGFTRSGTGNDAAQQSHKYLNSNFKVQSDRELNEQRKARSAKINQTQVSLWAKDLEEARDMRETKRARIAAIKEKVRLRREKEKWK